MSFEIEERVRAMGDGVHVDVRADFVAGVQARARRDTRRRRTGGATTVVVLVAVVALLVSRAGPPSHRVDVTGPGHLAPHLLDGTTSNVAFVTPQQGAVLVDGTLSRHGHRTSVAQVDTTSDGGRSWTATPLVGTSRPAAASSDLAFVDAGDGWAYGGQTGSETGTDGTGLWSTTDGGLSWTSQLPGQVVSELATSGRSAWVVANRTCRTCGERVYRSAAPGAPVEALPSQPPGSIVSLVRTTATTAFALTSIPRHDDRDLVGTDDGGQRWRTLPLPCQIPAHRMPGGAGILAVGDGSVWVTCAGAPTSMDSSEGPETLYRSGDGRAWQQVTPRFASIGQAVTHGLSDEIASLDPITARVGWILETDNEAGTGPVLRSADGGRTWTSVLGRYIPGSNPDEQLAIDSFAATSATTAFVTATVFEATYHPAKATTTVRGMHLVVLRTIDGGATWTATPITTPP